MSVEFSVYLDAVIQVVVVEVLKYSVDEFREKKPSTVHFRCRKVNVRWDSGTRWWDGRSGTSQLISR